MRLAFADVGAISEALDVHLLNQSEGAAVALQLAL
jgi:hypothetical protein